MTQPLSRRLEGNVAVVTGGGSGIGAAICHRFAAEGARVAALDISLPSAQRTTKEIGGGLAIEADVSDSAAVIAAFASVEDSLGPLDILVNNAGSVGLDHVRRVTPLLARNARSGARGVSRRRWTRWSGSPTGSGGSCWRFIWTGRSTATVAFLVSDDASYFVGATLSPQRGPGDRRLSPISVGPAAAYKNDLNSVKLGWHLGTGSSSKGACLR